MHHTVAKKVREIKNRVRDLKGCFILQVKNCSKRDCDPEDRSVPRVSGIVVREGAWLSRLASRMLDRQQEIGGEVDPKEGQIIESAKKFFEEASADFREEIIRNNFIYRLDAKFILHMEKMVLLVEKIDTQVKAKIAALASQLDPIANDDNYAGYADEEVQEEIDAEMTV